MFCSDHQFVKVVINGLKISRPNEFYRIFYRHVFSPDLCVSNLAADNVSVQSAAKGSGKVPIKPPSDGVMLKEIVERFERHDPSKGVMQCILLLLLEPIVLVLDEIDYLVDATVNKQPLIYNIFEWTKIKNARLVVVGLSNRLNFVEFFENKVLLCGLFC